MTITYSTLKNPWTIGFDSWYDRFERVRQMNDDSRYPPYNMIKKNDETWGLEIAVAGFSAEDLSVELADNVLTVSGQIERDEEEPNYIHRGLASRAFTRKWTLSDDVVVNSVKHINGILHIELERIIPEEKKPRSFDIESF